jgi:hypothetical protein
MRAPRRSRLREDQRSLTHEERRLEEARHRSAHWKRWGPYLSERAWGTVREDYSPHGTAWDYFPHDHARSKAYRWGEDGIGGICDRHQAICSALAFWNGHDPMLKERLFGLTGNEGNHGEDVKEYYFYLDSTPTHSYMKFLYKYPQRAYPYAQLVEENRRRGRQALEYELLDTGVFAEDRYFDVCVEYAKGSPEDILIRIQVVNRGPETAEVDLLPTIWFRNTWSWGYDVRRPHLSAGEPLRNAAVIDLEHYHYGARQLCCEGAPALLFTENETNNRRLHGTDNPSPYVAAHYHLALGPGETATVRLRFAERDPQRPRRNPFAADFEQIFATRQREADEFYATVIPQNLSADAQRVMRQACAGLLWSKQFYH